MEHDDDRRLLLTVPEAAAALAIGRTTLYELVATGQLATVHIGRAVRIPRGRTRGVRLPTVSDGLTTMKSSQPRAAS